eukprot:7392743-Heterocapsa_arctica.AAC.1
MLSREGELVNFVDPVKIDGPINAWLSKTEAAMHASLGENLSAAVPSMDAVLEDGQVIEAPFMEWVSKYPCQ